MPPGMGMPPQPPAMPEPEPEVTIPEEEWDELHRDLKAKYQDGLDHWGPWREEARKDFEFVAGDQWDEETKNLLKSQLRPAMTFNTIGAMIDSIAGYEVANRQEPRFIQRNMGAAGVSELVTSGALYFRDNTDAEHHESEAFRNTAICGVWALETLIDFDDNEDGEYRKRCASMFEVVPDANAREHNLSDAKHVFRAKKMTRGEALDMFPDADPADINAAWADDEGSSDTIRDEFKPNVYERDDDEDLSDSREITIVEAQWFRREPYMRFVDPMSGQITTLSKPEFEAMSERVLAMGLRAPRAQTIRRKVWYRAFLGKRILSVTGTPAQKHFTYQFITAKRHEVKGTFYGIVRGLRDPQSFLNKSISTIQHILNTNAKGGIMSERRAFEDPRKASETWARPDSITWLAPGGAALIQPKPQTQINPANFQLVDFAMGMGPKIAGVNSEFLGQQTTDQAGVLEYQRKQSTITVLATAFDNLKLYRIADGRYTLRLMQLYLSDGRLVRIVGEEGQRFLPLNRDATLGEYEVIVDDAPTSPNQKEQQWAVMQSLMQMMGPMVAGNPELQAEMMKDAPLAESRKAKIAEILGRKDPGKEAMGAEQAQAQKAMAYAKINAEDAKAEQARATALKTVAETVTPFLAVPPQIQGPFPVGPQPPMMPQGPMGGPPGMPPGPPGMPPGMMRPPGMPPGMPPMPVGGPTMPIRPPGAPMPPNAIPGAPVAAQVVPGITPGQLPPNLRMPGQG